MRSGWTWLLCVCGKGFDRSGNHPSSRPAATACDLSKSCRLHIETRCSGSHRPLGETNHSDRQTDRQTDMYDRLGFIHLHWQISTTPIQVFISILLSANIHFYGYIYTYIHIHTNIYTWFRMASLRDWLSGRSMYHHTSDGHNKISSYWSHVW